VVEIGDALRWMVVNHEELREAARQQPFMPFRVLLTTGDTYDIRHPDLIMVGRRSVIIGIAKNAKQPGYDRTLKVDLFHVVGIDELSAPPGNAD